jgi:hypothetical protein
MPIFDPLLSGGRQFAVKTLDTAPVVGLTLQRFVASAVETASQPNVFHRRY